MEEIDNKEKEDNYRNDEGNGERNKGEDKLDQGIKIVKKEDNM